MKHLFIFIALFFTSLIYSQDTVYARKIIKKLTSKEFLGRGYVNDGVNKAAKYLAAEYKAIGLKPMVGKSYLQTYTFNVNTFPNKMSVVLDGRTLVPGKHYLIYPSAQKTGSSFQLFKSDSVTYKATDGRKEVPLQVKLKKKLTYTVATKLSEQTTVELLKDSFPNELHNVDVIFENKFIPNFKCNNVCGFVKGTAQPDSFIIFSAHYDHLGAMGKDTYFPGANDNASGVSMVLNLAKYYQLHPAKYSVAFILFSGEEAGLLGSKYYSEHPLFPLSKIKFLNNLDLLGTGSDGIMAVNATVFPTHYDLLKQINDSKNYVKHIKQRGKASNSDHYWFSEKGVPCFFIYTMGGEEGGYHDIYDVAEKLPLTKYLDVCKLLIEFNAKL